MDLEHIFCLVFSLACLGMSYWFVTTCEAGKYVLAVWQKTAASLCFLIVALFAATERSWSAEASVVFFALLLGLLGDVLLALRYVDEAHGIAYFSAGATAFAVGHLGFLYVLIRRGSLSGLVPLLLLVFLLGGLGYLKWRRTDFGPLKVKSYAYLTLVALMGSCALAGSLAVGGTAACLFAAGGLLFVISDHILCAFNFGTGKSALANHAIHATYYLAQLCIAWSIFY